MNARSLTTAVIVLLLSGLALADESAIDGVYRGTLGKQDIVLDIHPFESDAGDPYGGRYFYRRHGTAIPLKIETGADGKLRVLEYHDGAPTGAQWLLVIDGDKASADFCTCDVRNAAVFASSAHAMIALTLIAGTRNQPHEEAYNAQLLDSPLTDGREIRVADRIAYVTQTNPRFSVSLPHLTQFPDAAVMRKVNDGLAKALDDHRLDVADCLFVGEQSGGAHRHEEYRVALLNRDVLSIGGWASIQCGGGAHPENSVGVQIYDMHTGEPFDFEANPQAFFRSAQPPWDELHDLYIKYAKLSRTTPEECRRAGGDEADDVYDLNFDVAGHMYFDAKGLAIDPRDSVPHAVAACFEEVIVPYSEIRQFVRPDSPFYPLMAP